MILLDTHVLIWWIQRREELLGPRGLALLEAGHEDLVVSVASMLEIAAKQSKGKLLDIPPPERVIKASGIRTLSITASHAFRVDALPRLHGDPWDRLLIAQILEEGGELLTRDRDILRYDVPTIW